MAQPFKFFYYDNGTPKNLLGLDDAEVVSMIERDMTSWRMAQIQAGEAPEATRGNFDLDHLKAIHGHVFQDVYEWAGMTRAHELTVEGQQVEPPNGIAKHDGRVPLEFIRSDAVEQHLEETFIQLREQNFLQGLPREAFADRAAVTFARINDAHPFMEGNGRTQREFMEQLADRAGHELRFDVVSGERMSIVSYEARAGDVSSMQRLFQEITDPQRVQLLQEGQRHLEGIEYDWHQKYVATVTPGREYQGQVAVTSPDVVVVWSEGDILLAQTRDFERQPDTREIVSFTASAYDRTAELEDGRAGRGRQIDFDL
ncbi:Fic/DOC family protein [Deinococcus enclensis]|uniref:protein adenylyltransferase n=1 Tax=Deinococcus enclensis TaxID=1049582 RepID=A0ABT9MI70_9DEIO|nr:Fic family protein [Deinococcus enclensis]MDP9766151.1 cell filamentation protein [Deinococcus enclensis]